VINAPLRFVYNWCADFREDDPKIRGLKDEKNHSAEDETTRDLHVHPKAEREGNQRCPYCDASAAERLALGFCWTGK
jgi:hypothetical protein